MDTKNINYGLYHLCLVSTRKTRVDLINTLFLRGSGTNGDNPFNVYKITIHGFAV
jgi:hypothetical protein